EGAQLLPHDGKRRIPRGVAFTQLQDTLHLCGPELRGCLARRRKTRAPGRRKLGIHAEIAIEQIDARQVRHMVALDRAVALGEARLERHGLLAAHQRRLPRVELLDRITEVSAQAVDAIAEEGREVAIQLSEELMAEERNGLVSARRPGEPRIKRQANPFGEILEHVAPREMLAAEWAHDAVRCSELMGISRDQRLIIEI